MDVRVGLWRRLSAKELMLLNCGVGEDSWGSLGLQRDPISPLWRRSAVGFLWREWCWSWNSSTLATSCEELTNWKRLWCWEVLGAGGEGDNRGWGGWMASPNRWMWVWVNSGSLWWTGVLACYNSWGHKDSDMTEWPNWNYSSKHTKFQIKKKLKQKILKATREKAINKIQRNSHKTISWFFSRKVAGQKGLKQHI